jgi:hypothetical protein
MTTGAPERSQLQSLDELCRSSPSEVISRNSTSAKNDGSTHVARGFLIGLVSLDFGLMTVLSCFLISLDTVRDQSVPTCRRTELFSFPLSQIERRHPGRILHESYLPAIRHCFSLAHFATRH